MKITYFGNAMILLESKQTRLLCDPWVTFDRHSTSGLFNFPELNLTKRDVAALRPDYIYISHTHEDHFDPITLLLFALNTPILVADFENNFTERHVKALGFTDVRVVDGDKGAPLNGSDWCWIEPNGTYPDVDSLIITRLDEFTIANLNDNPFEPDQVKRLARRFSPIDLACVPFSFQGPYPAFYENLSPAERAAESMKKRQRNYDVMTQFAQTLQPQRLFPFAAGALYGGLRAKLFPFYGVGTASEAVEWALKSTQFKPLLLSAHGSCDLRTDTQTGIYKELSYEDHIEYIDDISTKRSIFDQGGAFWIAESERIDLTKLLQRARLKQQDWQERRGHTTARHVYFIDTGQPKLYRLCLADTTVTRVAEDAITDEDYEIFRVPYPLLVGVLTGHYNWSNIKTQYISFFRKPNAFKPDLHILMSFLQL